MSFCTVRTVTRSCSATSDGFSSSIVRVIVRASTGTAGRSQPGSSGRSVEEAATRGTRAAVELREEFGLRGPVTMQAAAGLLTEHFSTVEVHEFALESPEGEPVRGCGYIVARPSRGVLLCL